MLDFAKWHIQINDQTRFKFDSHNHFLEKLQSFHSISAYPSLCPPTLHTTSSCDRGPNSKVHRDFMFRKLTLCSILKPLSHEIDISWIRFHASPLIGWPRWISTFWDLSYWHFQTLTIRISHLTFSEMTFSMLILRHASLWNRWPRSFHNFSFRESSWLCPLTTPFCKSAKCWSVSTYSPPSYTLTLDKMHMVGF
jgi:hypothetical protein